MPEQIYNYGTDCKSAPAKLRPGNEAPETWPVLAEKWLKNVLKNKL